ncbi:MAG: xanthine dehydrogenase family protein subunit M [Thaumarchaeota archaeon]|nr:xanthine dehydrogenase family protein subunit M [Nitrososphaerota archaeon]
MTPKKFEYIEAKTVEEAVSLLGKYKDEAKLLAGGQSLLSLMKLRLAAPQYLIDINKIEGLSGIKELPEGGLSIGAMTRHYMIEKSELIQSRYPILCESTSKIGDPHIRSRGTIGGAICHADPSADTPPVVKVLDAEFKLQGPNGARIVKAEDFFEDMFTTTMSSEEIMSEIVIPKLAPRTGQSYIKFSRREGDFAIVAVAIVITFDERKVCTRARIALSGVDSKPITATKTEEFLIGKELSDRVIDEAASTVPAQIKPGGDVHGSAEYRSAMSEVFTKKALTLALANVGGVS